MKVKNGRLAARLKGRVRGACAPRKFVSNMRMTKKVPLIVPVDSPVSTRRCVGTISKLVLTNNRSMSPVLCSRRPARHLNIARPTESTFRVTLTERTCGRYGPVFTMYHNVRLVGITFNNDLRRSVDRLRGCSIRRSRGAGVRCTSRSVSVTPGGFLHSFLKRGRLIGSFRRRNIGRLTRPFRTVT